MGSRMARRLLSAGYPVKLYDPAADVRRAFDGTSATWAESPRDCAASDVIIIMVPGADEIDAVMEGEFGLRHALPKDASPLLVVMSTVLPETCVDLQRRVGRSTARVIDAPVSGGLFGAESGTLAILAGGETDDIETAMSVFRHLGKDVFRCGTLGSGQMAKVANNMLGIANMFGAAEVFKLAASNGLGLDVLVPILEAGSGRNFASEEVDITRGHYSAWANSREAFESLGHIVRKDLKLALKLAGNSNLQLPVLEGVSGAIATFTDDLYQRWRDIGYPADTQ
ncbi:MAG: 2-hydroxy-3-oxopropionate reductase (EC [uncultured Paraburkholderia sp.]|nr:MAG: 2-hydroxy-3-oxopropionate reductase (EC [uncultured Paraburkholderia sp.]CAH2912863.1 MAG: 2-hydroxy-3-oxopropionate reductase (EC [uncultured Paraburkholderia sp.]